MTKQDARNSPLSYKMSGTTMLLEETEIDTAIIAALNETRMGREIVIRPVLQHKEPFIGQERQNGLRNILEIVESIGRISKDDVILLFAQTGILEDIALERNPLPHLQFFLQFGEILPVLEVFLYRHNLTTATRSQLKRDGTCACKEIKGCRFCIKIDIHIL